MGQYCLNGFITRIKHGTISTGMLGAAITTCMIIGEGDIAFMVYAKQNKW
jgi:hypothetical protein